MATGRRPTGDTEDESPEPGRHRRTTTVCAEPQQASAATMAPRSQNRLLELVEFLAPVPQAVPAARRRVTGALKAWGLGGQSETAALLTCELVSNAVKHGSPGAPTTKYSRAQRIVLKVRHHDGLFIEVWDPGSKGLHPRICTAAPHDEVGRGLHLVDTLSRSWGHYAPASGGRTVWCELVPPQGGRGEPRTSPWTAS